MADAETDSRQEVASLQAEILRLNKIIQALMNRAERSTMLQGSDFNLFQTAIMLEEQVRHRTEELEAALNQVHALQAELREQAIRDPLTGLYNRRYLTETFDRELIRAQRNNRPIAIVMSDIDHFKAVNDTYGHSAGDQVLKVFSRLLSTNCRRSDICCRYGGEEFLVVMFDAPKKCSLTYAERARAAFTATSIDYGGSVIRATASFGISAFPEDGETSDALIAAADTALYSAKEGGRDQIKCCA